jgi:hypothetical protein
VCVLGCGCCVCVGLWLWCGVLCCGWVVVVLWVGGRMLFVCVLCVLFVYCVLCVLFVYCVNEDEREILRRRLIEN